ncbi:uncharacterized protein OCT59_005242 [Rhizophagus irregularis]|nr:hypothetical protein OCT59_005242 [Rhizophagus irregularis]
MLLTARHDVCHLSPTHFWAKQMCQSVCYFMRQVSIAEAPTLDDNSFEPIFDGEDSAETFAKIDKDRELDLQLLMATVNIDDIIEI